MSNSEHYYTKANKEAARGNWNMFNHWHALAERFDREEKRSAQLPGA